MIYKEAPTIMSFRCYHWSKLGNRDTHEGRWIGLGVIGVTKTISLPFAYAPPSMISLFRMLNENEGFRLSIANLYSSWLTRRLPHLPVIL